MILDEDWDDWEPDWESLSAQDQLRHYGILRKSGRYPWGSGGRWGDGDEDTAVGRSRAFYGMVNHLKAQRVPEVAIAQAMGLTVQDLRSTKSLARQEIIQDETQTAVRLREKSMSVNAIAEQTGMSPATVRLRLKNSENLKENTIRTTAEVIRSAVDKHGIVDIGKGTEYHVATSTKMGVADTKLKAAIALLHDEGYESYTLKLPRPGTKYLTNQQVMVPPGTGFGKAASMSDKLHTIASYTEDGGKSYLNVVPPLAINPKRVKVKYDEEGGTLEDGVIYVRRGVKDLDMGKNTYAQVRIQVGDGHFLKGMAVVSDDLPAGKDIVFNSNKKRSDPKIKSDLDTMKPLVRDKDGNVDQDNPFGSSIARQITKVDKDGNEKTTSALNIVNETGDWDNWRKSLPSQMLAKQPHPLIKSQLKVTRDEVEERLAALDKITNPVVRKKRLEDFADQIDADAVDLRAAAMPGQKTQVIIPMPKMRKDEIYAPNFKTGDKVVLIRYPHGGRFEIPEVTVNNNNRTAKKLLGNAFDAIGIHPSVAERLSGADFDGDTVVVIPNADGRIKGSKSMGNAAKIFDEGLKNYNPKELYGGYEVDPVTGKSNFKKMTQTGLEMGKITNLITDMQVQGASPDHVLRAVKHSMVVIDAEKHKLNYKLSEERNNISALRHQYQARVNEEGRTVFGASTLLSRATAKDRLPQQKARLMQDGGPIDPKTGERVYVNTGKTINKRDPKTGEYDKDVKIPVMEEYKRLQQAKDAYDLVRDKADPVERLYADHANEMKALANAARLRTTRIPDPPTNKAAKAVYKGEVDKLTADLNKAKAQAPLDRQAEKIARVTYKARLAEDPTLYADAERRRKTQRQAMAGARSKMGLDKPIIEITDRQWDAIQSGAVSPSKLREILRFAKPERIDELSTPRTNTVMTSSITSRAKAMIAAGATTADIAAALGVSASTLRAAATRGDL